MEGSDWTKMEGSDWTAMEGSDWTAMEGSDLTKMEGSDWTKMEGSDWTAGTKTYPKQEFFNSCMYGGQWNWSNENKKLLNIRHLKCLNP